MKLACLQDQVAVSFGRVVEVYRASSVSELSPYPLSFVPSTHCSFSDYADRWCLLATFDILNDFTRVLGMAFISPDDLLVAYHQIGLW